MAVHRTARGNAIDMSTLVAKNEKTRAVGNMNVNARGDIIDNQNKISKDNTKRVKNGYQKIVAQAQQKTAPVQPQKQSVKPPAKIEQNDLSAEEKELFEDDEDIDK